MQTSVKVFVLCLILCISLVTALQFGAKFISLDQIISALMSMIDANTTASMTDTIITDIRLPRLIYSVLTGIGLSLVGLLMQTVTRRSLCIRCFFWRKHRCRFRYYHGWATILRPVQYAYFCGPRRSTFNYISPLMCW